MVRIKNLEELFHKNPEMARVIRKVRVNWQGKYKSQARIGKHNFIMDEPLALGGENSGPGPMATLLSAIAACELSTCSNEAYLMNLKIEKMTVDISGMVDLRGIMGLADVPPGFQTIDLNLKITSTEPTEKIDLLVENVKKRCPVLNTLRNPPELNLTHDHVKP